MIATKAVALWGGGALLVTSIGASTALLVNTASAAPKTSKPPTTSPGNGQGGGNNGNGVGNGGGGASAPAKSLLVDEVVSGELVPGVPVTVTVTITNPNKQAVILTGITKTALSVEPASGQACALSNFTFAPVTNINRRLEKAGAAEAKDRTTVDVPLLLRETGEDQNGCKNAELTFTYTATANQA